MNCKGPWEGCLLPAFLCAHIFTKRETSGYEADTMYYPRKYKYYHKVMIHDFFYQWKFEPVMFLPVLEESSLRNLTSLIAMIEFLM